MLTAEIDLRYLETQHDRGRLTVDECLGFCRDLVAELTARDEGEEYTREELDGEIESLRADLAEEREANRKGGGRVRPAPGGWPAGCCGRPGVPAGGRRAGAGGAGDGRRRPGAGRGPADPGDEGPDPAGDGGCGGRGPANHSGDRA